MISKVMLDIDDVCNQFCMYALAYVGATPHFMPYAAYPTRCGWDIVAAARQLAPEGITYNRATFWDALDRNFWATIPPAPYLHELMRVLDDSVGFKNVVLASSPTKSPESLAGKLDWIHRFLPPELHRSYMIGPKKEYLAGPNALLIDDRRGNCEKFVAAGGGAVQVAKPWNVDDFEEQDTYESLFDGLENALNWE